MLQSFSCALDGNSSRGAFIGCAYGGDISDLDNLTLAAKISQGAEVMEKNIPLKIGDDGKLTIEMVDGLYEQIDPKTFLLSPKSGDISVALSAASQEGKVVENSRQTLKLGEYVLVPVLGDFYFTNRMCKVNEHVNEIAWDFVPNPSREYPTIVNTPVRAPIDGYAYVVMGAPTKSGTNFSIMVYSPETGYLIDMTHNASFFVSSEGEVKTLSSLSGTYVHSDDIIAMIGETDSSSGMPHTHISVKIIPSVVDVTDDPSKIANTLWDYIKDSGIPAVDFIGSDLFIDKNFNTYLQNLPNSLNACGNLPWGTLKFPLEQQLPFTIDGNASDWKDYAPVLTDPAGDSEAGKVMDFTELYTAKDDNYLYLMFKAGQKPSTEWAVYFNVDTIPGDQCGTADQRIYVWSIYPNSFSIYGLKGCDKAGDTSRYSTEYKWSGDVLEIKIPLMYLGDYTTLDITKVDASVENNNGWSTPDTIP